MGLNPRLYPVILVLAALAVAIPILAPYRAVPFDRSDGATVRLPGPERLSHTSDTWDYLQIARRLQAGEGFTSRFTFIPLLPESTPHQGSFPVLWRQPGYPYLVAAAFAVAGSPEPNAMVALSGLAMVGLALAAYGLGRAVLSPGWAFLAAGWTLLTPVTVGATDPLLATTLFAAWTALFVGVLLRARGSWAALGLGVLLGAGVLLRGETWVMTPGFLVMWFLARDRDRVRGAALMLAAAMVTVVPWHLHLRAVTGDAFYSITSLTLLAHQTDAFPGWIPYRTLELREITPVAFALDHPGDLARKTILNLARFGRDFLFLPSVLLAPLFWLSVLRPSDRARGRALVWGTVVAAAGLVVAFSPLVHTVRFLAPLVSLFAVGAAFLLARLPRHGRILAGAATVVGAVTLVSAIAGRAPDLGGLTAARDLNTLFSRDEAAGIAADAVILSDAGCLGAWVWDRPVVEPPLAAELARVRKMLGPVVGIVTSAASPPGVFEQNTLVGSYEERGAEVSGEDGVYLVTWPEEAP